MKKAQLLAIILVLALALSSCTGSGNVKDEMNKLNREDLGFVCWYDSSWLVAQNTDTVLLQAPAKADGVTNETIMIRSVEYDGDASEYAVEYLKCNDIPGFILKKDNLPAKVGGKDGTNYVYVYNVGDALYRSCNFAVRANERIYVITYTSAEEVFDVDTAVVSAVIEYIEFVDIVPAESKVIDYNGGKAESVNKDFRFDYPAGWGIEREDGLISVCRSDSKASVTVQAFSLPTEKSSYGANQFWEEYEAEIKATFSGYVLIDGHDGTEYKLGKVPACRKDYSLSFDGGKYIYTQYAAIADGYVFSVVFCGDEADHAKYLADFESMIASFEID